MTHEERPESKAPAGAKRSGTASQGAAGDRGPAAATPGVPSATSVTSPLAPLRRGPIRLRTLITLRWLAIAGQLTALFVVAFGLGYELPLMACLGVIAASAFLNVAASFRYPVNERLSERAAAAYLGFDLVQLFFLLLLTGGITNPFALLFLAPATISATTLRTGYTLALVGLSFVLITVLALFHWPLPWAGAPPSLPGVYILGMWIALILGLGFLTAYAWRVAQEGRRMSAALAATQLVLSREQRLVSLGGMAAAAAHELGTPLATIALVAKELERDLPDGSAQADDAKLLRGQAERCRQILRQLSDQSRADDAMHARMSLATLLEEVVEPHRGFEVDIEIAVKPAEDFDGKAPEVPRKPELIHGLGNFVENAVDFAVSQVRVAATYDAEKVVVRVSDDGPGFSSEVLARLGEPYITTRPAAAGSRALAESPIPDEPEEHEGMGLGFFIAKTLLERTGARVSADNGNPRHKHLSGACVTVTWPRASLVAQPLSAPDPAQPGAGAAAR